MRLLGTLLLVLFLAGCGEAPVRVGSKDNTESRILAEMFAQLLEEEGVAVERQPRLGPTEVVFQALKNGAIDLYPEYTGSALALMGASRMEDPDEAFALVSETLAQSGLTILDRLGFHSGTVVLMRPAVAKAESLETVADLLRVARRLRLGVVRSFAERPRDGLESYLDRFGLSFAKVEVFPDDAKEELYDALLEDRVDVVVGVATDPEISDYDLKMLADPSGFFPIYEAAPLASTAALSRSPQMGTILSALADRIDEVRMREMNAAVRLDGRPPNRVARQALYELGLVGTPPRERTPIFAIATEPEVLGTEVAINTLRAVRRAMRGRDVNLIGVADPLEAVAVHEARLALAPAVSGFVEEAGFVISDERFEAIAAVGSTFLHAFSAKKEPVSPLAAETIASGPVGSPSWRLARVIAASTDHEVAVVPLEGGGAVQAAEAVREEAAEVALVFAVPGRTDIGVALAGGDVTLVDAAGWWKSSARLALPVMREAQINVGTYPELEKTVATLATQIILFGPAAPDHFVIGHQGPNAIFDEIRPLQDQNVEAINRNLGLHAAVDPHLRRATALTPEVNLRDDRINPYPGRAILTLVILTFVVWAGWLLVRRERADGNV